MSGKVYGTRNGKGVCALNITMTKRNNIKEKMRERKRGRMRERKRGRETLQIEKLETVINLPVMNCNRSMRSSHHALQGFIEG